MIINKNNDNNTVTLKLTLGISNTYIIYVQKNYHFTARLLTLK